MSRCKSPVWRRIRRERRARRRWLRFEVRFAPKPFKTWRTMERLHGKIRMTGEIGRIEGIRWMSI